MGNASALVRRQAAEILSICANQTQWQYGAWSAPGRYRLAARDFACEALARGPNRRAWEDDDWLLEYAEAEALVRSGWNPPAPGGPR